MASTRSRTSPGGVCRLRCSALVAAVLLRAARSTPRSMRHALLADGAGGLPAAAGRAAVAPAADRHAACQHVGTCALRTVAGTAAPTSSAVGVVLCCDGAALVRASWVASACVLVAGVVAAAGVAGVGIHRLRRLRRAGDLPRPGGEYQTSSSALIEAGADVRRVGASASRSRSACCRLRCSCPRASRRCQPACSAPCWRTSCGTCAAATGPGWSSRRSCGPRSGSTRRCGGSCRGSSRRARKSSTS